MSDLLERLAAANPIPESDQPSIDGVWRKVSELRAEPPAGRRTSRRRPPRGAGRATLTLAAVLVPIVVVLAVAIPLHGARDETPRPTPPAAGHATPTLDPAGQRVAARALAGRVGSIVALDPRTGAVKVMYANTGRLSDGQASDESAVEARYPPGATFDIVTAAAALDTGRYTPSSRIAGASPLTVSGTPLRNDGNQSFGRLTLTQSLSYSVDTVFAQVGESAGRQTMTTYMRRFGFYASPRLGPTSLRLAASGVRLGGGLVSPTSGRVDLGRLAVGQGRLVATPLQMAMVAAAVADGGKLMSPHLETIAPTLFARVMDPATARALTQMMREVVTHGTGTPAGLAGLQIAGKTGTAHLDGRPFNLTDAWFIGFAPANHPTLAVAVMLGDIKDGSGGTQAAPIAARVIGQLLGHPGH